MIQFFELLNNSIEIQFLFVIQKSENDIKTNSQCNKTYNNKQRYTIFVNFINAIYYYYLRIFVQNIFNALIDEKQAFYSLNFLIKFKFHKLVIFF